MRLSPTPVYDETPSCRINATMLSVLPRRLVRFRELRRITQTELAERANISRSTLNILEAGQAGNVMVLTVARLGDALGVTPDALLGYDTLDLVRAPLMPQIFAPSLRDVFQARTCDACSSPVPARTIHTQADCIVTLSYSGRTAQQIGAQFGLMASSVDAILRDEHEARRHRRF